jgi:AcrR family transcriptional regulator
MLQVKLRLLRSGSIDVESEPHRMDPHTRARDDEALGDPPGDDVVHRLISDELGDTIAELLRRGRQAQEIWHRRAHPHEGLRERKRRLTRQLISDAATSMFTTRGFDNVKVSEVADRVGVSEKTIYNYFPTKEALVLDTADESLERLAQALRERRPAEPLTDVVLRALKADTAGFDGLPDELIEFIPRFGQMIDGTPTLRAAWLELHDRLAKVVRDELAAQAEVAPSDPEPMVAGRALAGLADVAFESRVRHITAGLRGDALRDAVNADLERAARLLEVGLWSFRLLTRGARTKAHALEAAKAADEARVQVVKALKQAHAAWTEVRRHT